MKEHRYIVVLDGGTSSIRCTAFRDDGDVAATRSAPWPYLGLPDASPTTREFDVEASWRAVCAVTQATLKASGAREGSIAAVTATSQRQAVVFLDRDGGEIYAGPNIDLRALFEGIAIDQSMGDRMYQTTGHAPSFMLAAAKLQWFRKNAPEAYGKISTVLTLADWFNYKLSGILASEPTLAGEAGLLHIHWRKWCSTLLQDAGVIGNAHVPLAASGTLLGTVTPQASASTGIPVGTPVAVAGADTQCGLLGLGISQPGQMGIVAGWSAPVQMVTDRPVLEPRVKTWAGCHLLEDRWVCESTSGDTGNSYAWLAATMWRPPVYQAVPTERSPFAEMEAAARRAPPGANGTLAYLGQARVDMTRLGMRQGGVLFPVPLTYSEVGPAHIVRASLESIAYAVTTNVRQTEAIVGSKPSVIAVGGGMTQTSLWTEILANVLGQPIGVAQSPRLSGYGAYLCAAMALGEFATLDEAARAARTRLKTIEPHPVESTDYADLYKQWLKVDSHLQALQE